jgi:hypothetical protein
MIEDRHKSIRIFLKSAAVLLLLALLAAGKGCTERTQVSEGGDYRWQQSGAGWREELLVYAIDSLNQMEKFQTQETFIRIFRQIYAWRQSAENKKDDPSARLVAAWPKTEMLDQIIDRLNQWIHFQTMPNDWKPDPLINTLPKSLKELPLVKGLGDLSFNTFEGYYLQENVYLRDVANMARGDVLDDLSRAKNLFDWTIRNIQLEADTKDRIPLFPWEALYFGRGTALERAWVFILLARQEGLDAVLLALADPAENTPIARGIRPLQPWCVAVLVEGRAYLFDPLLGLPIPAKDGIKRDVQGRLELQPATLEEVVADESLLRRLDLDADNPYPVQAADLKNVVALVEASPSSLSCRMKLVESRLAGRQKMILTASATRQAERWKALAHISRAQLWLLPYETLQRRSQLTPEQITRRLAEFLEFYALSGAPLSKGRLLQLKGQFIGQQGATQFYQASRPSYQELEYLSALPSEKDLDKMQQDLLKLKNDLTKAGNNPTAQPSPFLHQQKQDINERMVDVDLARMGKKLEEEYTSIVMKTMQFKSEEERKAALVGLRQEALQILLVHILLGKQDATYWLGIVAYQRGNYPSAVDYFLKRTLEMHPNGLWSHGARYNLARTVEAAGEIDRAAMMYQADPDAPDVNGRQLRARWLLEKEHEE